METNLDGEIDRPCSGHEAARPGGMSRTSDVRVRKNIGRNSGRLATIDLAVPAILVTIDLAVPAILVTIDLAVPAILVTIDRRATHTLRAAIGPLAVRVALVVIDQVVLGLRTPAGRRGNLRNLGVPPTISRSREQRVVPQ
jgi:hypothetical protein